jgi:hypothetical protein
MLRTARQHRGLTQEQLAQLLDVRMATISERENSDVGVSWEIWVAWASVLGLPSDWQPSQPVPPPDKDGPEHDS